MAEHKETLKKKVMKTFWRVQQAQMVISVVFWSMTLTGIFYPMIVEKLKDYPWWGENTFFGLMVFFLLVLGGIFLFGFFGFGFGLVAGFFFVPFSFRTGRGMPSMSHTINVHSSGFAMHSLWHSSLVISG